MIFETRVEGNSRLAITFFNPLENRIEVRRVLTNTDNFELDHDILKSEYYKTYIELSEKPMYERRLYVNTQCSLNMRALLISTKPSRIFKEFHETYKKLNKDTILSEEESLALNLEEVIKVKYIHLSFKDIKSILNLTQLELNMLMIGKLKKPNLDLTKLCRILHMSKKDLLTWNPDIDIRLKINRSAQIY